nr:hypothetical protein [Tanacetum cinerariifolium]
MRETRMTQNLQNQFAVGVSTPAAASVNNAGISEFHSTDYPMTSVSTLNSTVNSVEIPIVDFSGDYVELISYKALSSCSHIRSREFAKRDSDHSF